LVVRILSVALTALALLGILLAFFLPWGSYDVDRTGPACPHGNPFCYRNVTAEYNLWSTRYELSNSSVGADVQNQTTWFNDWNDDVPGVDKIRVGGPLVATAMLLAFLGLIGTLAGMFTRNWMGPAGGILIALAFLAMAIGIVFFTMGVQNNVDSQTEDPRGDLAQNPDAFSWQAGLYAGSVGAGLLLVGALLALLPHKAPPRGAPEPAEPAEPAKEVLELPPGADAKGRPPRQLRCPRCRTEFIGKWGEVPVCPKCKYTKPPAQG
jgi:hypothetical protein